MNPYLILNEDQIKEQTFLDEIKDRIIVVSECGRAIFKLLQYH